MAAGLKNRGYLDPKTCWKEWTTGAGSLPKVRAKLFQDGILNEKTGNPPTESGIEKAAFSWAIANQEEAREDLTYAWAREGKILTDDAWTQFIYDAARLVYHQRPRKLAGFLNKNGY